MIWKCLIGLEQSKISKLQLMNKRLSSSEIEIKGENFERSCNLSSDFLANFSKPHLKLHLWCVH